MARLNWLDRIFNQLAGASDSAVYYNLVDKTGAVYPAGTPPYKLVPANTVAQAGTPHSAANDNLLLQLDDCVSAPTADKVMRRDAAGRAQVANPSAAGDITNKGSVDTLLTLKAPLASPAFTGNPTAPTPVAGDNDTSIATTAFVKGELGTPTDAATANQIIKRDASGRAKIADPSMAGDITNKGAVDTLLALKAPLASPALTGNPTAPTPGAGDNDTSIATTAFVNTAINAGSLYVKIRDIADTSASGSIAIATNDISFATYREIKIVGKFTATTLGQIQFGLSGSVSSFTTKYIGSSLTTIQSNTAMAFTGAGNNIAMWGLFEFRIWHEDGYAYIQWSLSSPEHQYIWQGTSHKAMASVSDFLIFCSGATVYVKDVEIWGVKT